MVSIKNPNPPLETQTQAPGLLAVKGGAIPSSVLFWNRNTSQVEAEKVYGESGLKWAYRSRLGRFLTHWVLSRAWVSRLSGAYQSSRWSCRKIAPFIQRFEIPMDDFESGPFQSFNDFFIRKFKPGIRSFAQDPKQLAAFAEGRYFAFEKVAPTQKFPVKGSFLSAEALLGDSPTAQSLAQKFEGGPLVLARLCPTDYHRFHFPDSGRVVGAYPVPGRFHSVNPIAIQARNEIFATNERRVTLLETVHFGLLAMIEVGAMGVGKIVETHPHDLSFQRGDEKGYFLFGGSTVIVLGQPNRWKPSQDLLNNTQEGREVLVRLGDPVGDLQGFI